MTGDIDAVAGEAATGPDEASPLGHRAAVARIRQHYPELADSIDDLEAIVTPEFDRADRAAIDTQARLKRTRVLELAGGAVVAVLALVRIIGEDDTQWAGIAAAIAAGATGVVAAVGRRHGLDQWLDNRRIAEELRSLYFRWLVGPHDVDRPERRRRLGIEVNRIIEVEPVRVGPDLTGASGGGSDLPASTWELYRDARLRDQLAWMRSRSERVSAASQRLEYGQIALMGAAAVCGLLSAFATGINGQLLAVPVAAMAVLVGFLASIDALTASDRLAQHYERTVRRLALIDRSLDGQTGSLGDVEEIESVLMAEHRTWHRLTEGNQP